MEKTVFCLSVLFLLAGCDKPKEAGLKDVFENHFYFGAALNPGHFNETDEMGLALLNQHFNSATAENVMKWMYLQPQPDSFDFAAADKFMDFAEKQDMFIIGHTLVWHSQTPAWVFEDENGNPLSREALLERMENHIRTVMTRYKGRVHGWDVVNEALNDDGYMRKSPWYTIIGEDYVAKAFEIAGEVDPDAELYYNDYNLHNPAKREGAYRLVKSIQEQGIEVTGIGMQGHWGIDYPTQEQLEGSILRFSELGIVAITELDMDVLPAPSNYQGADVGMTAELQDSLNPYTTGLPDSIAHLQAQQYAMIFNTLLKHSDKINRVTTWGITDADSWKNDWPVPGRTNYTLLFDRDGKPKPAYDAIISIAKN